MSEQVNYLTVGPGGLCFAHGPYTEQNCPQWPKCASDPRNDEFVRMGLEQVSHDSHIANLEWRVVEAAVARRVEQKRELFSMTGVELCWQEDDAVDSLIAAREAELKEE